MSIAAKLPPQDLEAEQAVLGSCMLDPMAGLKATEILPNAGDFYRESHQIIYNSILDLMNKSEPVDVLTVGNELRKRSKFEEVGGGEYLTELLNVMPTTANVEHYAKIVREKAIMRNLIYAGSAISDLGYKEQDDAGELLDRAESIVFNIAQKRITRDFDPLKDSLYTTYERISELYAHRSHVTGVPTNFKDFDQLTAGFQKSDLIILAARPAMGKTALALNIAMNAAVKSKLPVAIFSLEMSKEQLALRFLCSSGEIDGNRLRTGFLGEADWPRLTRAMNDLAEAPIYMDDTPHQSVLEMRSKARRLQKNYGLSMLVVDYIQLIRGTSTKSDNRVQELSEISRQLKGLAKELNIPVICLSQLSRKVEERPDKRPMLSDLRESGAIEQDADMVIFIYRDGYYKRGKGEDGKEKPDNVAEIIVAKHRNGPVGTVKLLFLGQYTRFDNLEQYIEE
ncbi:MAG: replicative DNA helicase [Firmicutes bacterium]|nr:replicative DNA helicase [Bacillota bacterium]